MLERLLTDLCLYKPFMARAALSTPAQWDDTVATACTDGRVIRFSPEFMAGLSASAALGVYAHEVGHSLLFHFERRGGRSAAKWNAAADLELNQVLLECGFELPGGALLPAQFDLQPGLAAEEYYALLPDGAVAPNECMPDQPDQPKIGGGDWRDRAAATLWGDVPAYVARVLGRIVKGKPASLVERIAHWLSATLPGDDETWAPPSRRYSLLPDVAPRPGGHVAVCVDTSGSVDEHQLAVMVRDIRGLAGVGRVDVIMADADVRAAYEDISDTTPLHPIGGGGTVFQPALARAATLGADCAIYMTDGHGDRQFRPPLPTYWHIIGQEA